MIDIKPTLGTTHLIVCNYDSYQNFLPPKDHQKTTKRPSKDHQKTTTKQGNNENNSTIKQLKESLSILFEKDFWPVYPKKVSKKKALESWCNRLISLKVGEDFVKETIIPSLQVQKESEQWVRESGRYIPHPATWINQEKWDDEKYKSDDIWESL